ncbi:MAG: hypothetical protein RMK98_08730, partial [Bacteroidia bacterium]|nr:hypothetical protein [Bacteroidia bacterium]
MNWCLSNPAPTVTVANHSTISAIPQFLGYVWIVAGPSYYQVVQQGPSPSHTLTPHPVIPGLQLIVKIALQGDGTPSCPNDTSKSSRIFIYLDTMPPVPLLSGPVQTCFNQAPFTFQVLNHSTISGHPGFIGYTWSLNGSSLGSTGTSPTYTFAHGLPAGQHSIIVNAVFNSLCAAAKSDTMLFKIDTFLTPIDMLPPPALVSNPQVPFCYTYPPSVTVSISNAAIIQSNPLFVGFSWEVNGVFQAGASGPTLTISNPQVDMTVRAYAIYRNTCGKDSIFGRTYLYLFNPPFPAPYLGETLIYCDPDSTTHYVFNHAAVSSAPGFLGYLWFMNGQYQGASVGPSFT